MSENLKIRIGICGYGNLGKGVEKEISKNPDMELVCIFTRRNIEEIAMQTNTKVESVSNLDLWKDKIDVMILCGGSAKDLPIQGVEISKLYNTIDSFDTHADIPTYLENVNKSATFGKNISIISIGWDPGLFSLNRLISESVLPNGKTYTFWGTGVSQGHSDAIRQIKGVKNAVQYTIPIEETVNKVRNGDTQDFSIREKHLRQCFVVLEEGADAKLIEHEIKTMPKYFADYDTTVEFISEEELNKKHSKMPHGGFVIRSGNTGDENKQILEYSLKLDSNPEFTSSVLIAYARAAYRLNKNGEVGARTIFDIPPYLLSYKDRNDLIKELL